MRTQDKFILKKEIKELFLFVLLLPLFILYVPIYLVLWFAYGLALHIAIWIWWCTRGKYALIVYSNSPVWQDYFASQVLPALENRGVVLNWSERQQWRRKSLAVLAFWYFGGDREFNPLAIVFRPGRFRRVFRFWRPFLDFKHGKPQPVERMRDELLGLIPPASRGATTATPKTGSV